jgi:hypothetical protein
MTAQWDIQQALSDLRAEMNDRFDTLEARHLSASVDRASLEGRVANLEEKAAWIGAGIGTALFGIAGLFVAWLKAHWIS